MEIRMAYPNEIKRIMEIIQDAKESLAQRQVDQWQDGYPDEEIIFEDILESRGYVAVEDQEVVAYAAVYKGNEAAYNEIYDGKWEHDNYMYVTFHRVAVAKEAAGKGVAQTFLQGLIEGEKGPDFRCDTHPDNLVMDFRRGTPASQHMFAAYPLNGLAHHGGRTQIRQPVAKIAHRRI